MEEFQELYSGLFIIAQELKSHNRSKTWNIA